MHNEKVKINYYFQAYLEKRMELNDLAHRAAISLSVAESFGSCVVKLLYHGL